MKEAVVLLAHGSRRQEGNIQVEDMVKQIQQQDTKERKYTVGFLEFAHPTPDEGVKELIDFGAEKIIVVPLFLIAGKHVWRDIPDLVQQQKEIYPEVEFVLTNHLGENKKLIKIIIDMIESGGSH
ncbi:MAG: hypothetical protein FH758_14425 [Firmicutes bacterium]|nr:hypothetical protein [Bacillota bacterium]